MSNYWKIITRIFKIKLKYFIVYYPQTDGQTERINQMLEQYLQYYFNQDIDNQIKLLPLAKLSLSTRHYYIKKSKI